MSDEATCCYCNAPIPPARVLCEQCWSVRTAEPKPCTCAACNALAGRDPAKLEALVEAVEAHLRSNGRGIAFLHEALAAFEGVKKGAENEQ